MPSGAQMYYSNKYHVSVPIAPNIAKRIMELGGVDNEYVQRYFNALEEVADAEFMLMAD
jgi:hypothetical protein